MYIKTWLIYFVKSYSLLIIDLCRYATRVEKILRSNLGVDLNAEAEFNVTPAEEADKDEKKDKIETENLFEEQEDEDDDDSTDPAKPHHGDEL